MPRNIAVVGQFAAGKTTVANLLVEQYGFTRISMAAPFKKMAARLYNNGQPIDKSDVYEVTHPNGGIVLKSGREMLQDLGQVVKNFDRDFWLRWLAADIRDMEGPFVIDDVRFPFEADFLRGLDFTIVKLVVPDEVRMERYEKVYGRLPTQAELAHPSETEVAKIDPDFIMLGTDKPQALAYNAFMAAANCF